ncbi:SAM-dependent methyltransferase [Embleya sp. MST-111070]|uniref:SAM-dependent methyltransferase n=1 Tax=Embleya sp. MST-111070 TaxID=3398231 RepID=UPI003F73BDCF
MRHSLSLAIDLGLDRPHVARVNDYLAGGRTHFSADRALADAALAVHPELPTIARDASAFMRCAVDRLARVGIRQFVDFAQGIPIEGRAVHDVAHAVDRGCRVVYVEDDPIVHAVQSALSSTDSGRVACVRASPLRPESVWRHPCIRAMFDLGRPVAVVVGDLLQHLPFRYGPRGVLHHLTAGLAPGSRVVMTHLVGDTGRNSRAAALARVYRSHGIPLRLRDRGEVLSLVPGTLLDPGLVPASRWLPVLDIPVLDIPPVERVVDCYAAVGELGGFIPSRRTGT